ncbi:hypothetical protein Hdeb2414_s0087g00785961 [Helianthus debilis subsp. tardiflorus]
MNSSMSSKQIGLKSRKSSSKYADSPVSSTKSSSKLVTKVSVDDLRSPVSVERLKENVAVTVRFRLMSPREIWQGGEIAWYADGETTARNENNPSVAYAYNMVYYYGEVILTSVQWLNLLLHS